MNLFLRSVTANYKKMLVMFDPMFDVDFYFFLLGALGQGLTQKNQLEQFRLSHPGTLAVSYPPV